MAHPQVKLFASDVDGTLTDGAMYYSEKGEALKRFDTRDGHGIGLLHAAGIAVALVTSEDSPIVQRRAEKLAIKHVALGVRNKVGVVTRFAAELGLELDQVAFVGDDVNDAAVIAAVGLGFAVADAHPDVKACADVVLTRPGGHGAVREAAERVLGVWREKDEPAADRS